MTFTINTSHRLLRDGRSVERIAAPSAHTSGAYSPMPKIAIIHFTFGSSGRSSAEWFRNPGNTGRSSAHVVVDRDGSVIQCVDFNIAPNHAGRSSWRGMEGMNRRSFGIELANWGYLERRGGGWTSYTGASIADPVMARHRNGNPNGEQSPIGWEPYPAAQLAAAVEIVQALVGKYGVTEILGHDDISPGRKWDPGPAFDMAHFRARVLEDLASDEPNRMQVSSPDGLNLRRGPGTEFEPIVLLPDATVVEPVEQNGNWVLVNVIGPGGQPTKSGWVHSRFLA